MRIQKIIKAFLDNLKLLLNVELYTCRTYYMLSST